MQTPVTAATALVVVDDSATFDAASLRGTGSP